jgi:4-amino-4-deoxy-L-arabinose transferase-like glycosyltransferase
VKLISTCRVSGDVSKGQFRARAYLGGVLALIAGILAFDRAHTRPGRTLATWDEAIYYNVAQNVLDGRWLLPLHSNADHPLGIRDPFLHKPPLVYWIDALSMGLFGETVASARLTTAFATALIVALIVGIAVREAGIFAGVVAGWFGLKVPALYGTHAGNNVATDPFLVLFALGAVFVFFLALDSGGDREPVYAVLSGVLGGLAVLSKGVAVGPVALGCLPLAVYSRRQLSRRSWGFLFGGAILVVLPWFVAVAALAPTQLWEQMIYRQAVQRATGAMFISNPGTFPFMDFPYFRTAPDYFGLVWWLALVAVVAGPVLDRLNRVSRRLQVFVWPLAVTIIGVYAVAGNHQWYYLPAAPVLVVGVAVIGAKSMLIIAEVISTKIAFQTT